VQEWLWRAYGARHREVQASIDRLYDLTERVHEGVFEIRTRDLNTLYWDFYSSPLGRMSDGRRIVMSIAIDVTEKHRAEAQLRRRALQQAHLAELGREALSGMPLETLFQHATEQVARGLDVPLCKVLELLPDRSALRLVAGVGWKPGLVGTATVGIGPDSQAGYTLASDQPVIVPNLRLEARFSGPPLLQEHEVISGLSVVIPGLQEPFGVLGAHSVRYRHFTEDDIHFVTSVANILGLAVERHRTEQELVVRREQAEHIAEFRSRVLNSLSHDLRTPLTGIIGFAAMLADELEGPSRDHARLIVSSGQRLIDMLNAVVDYGKLEAGRVELRPEPMDLLQEVREVMALMQPLAEEKGLALRLEAPEAPVQVMADPSALSRILVNLVSNAIKFTDAGYVAVTVREDADHVCIEVKDTGQGIAPAFQADLFKAFHQERRGIGRSHEGAGLGLSIARRLTEHMGGT
ncbi:MAG: hybrid sensor histidine kinase/response regulator, partial [Bacteroidetes bacterium]